MAAAPPEGIAVLGATNKRLRRASVGRALPNVGPVVFPGYVAEFLPVEQRYGTLRRVSQGWRAALPAEPTRPLPAFTLQNSVYSGTLNVQMIGTFTLAQLRPVLEQIQSGAIAAYGVSPYSGGSLRFFYTPVGQVIPALYSPGAVGIERNTEPDFVVAIPPAVPGIGFNALSPKAFTDINVDPFGLDYIRSVDWVLAQLWAVVARKQAAEYAAAFAAANLARAEAEAGRANLTLPAGVVNLISGYLEYQRQNRA